MSLLSNLQVKVLLSALIPGSAILIIVALIALYAYGATVLDVVEQRDAELARLTADRLGDGLDRQTMALGAAAADPDVRTFDRERVRSTLEILASEMRAFDGGVTVYDQHQTPVWTTRDGGPTAPPHSPIPAELQYVRQSAEPSYSDVFVDPQNGNESVMITVPIVDGEGEFLGAVAGISTLRGSLMSAMFSGSLDVAPGEQGLAYLVDRSGRSIFHGRPSLVAADFTQYPPVAKVSAGMSGANLSKAPTGEWVISGFAPVAGTGWGVVTQQLWSDVEGPIRNSSWMVLGLLVLGALLASAGIWFFIGRALKPIRELNAGAQRIAGGEFNHRIQADTGDEVQQLAQQFNVMAEAIEASHAELAGRVELRGQELAESEARMRAVITGAPVMILALDTEGRVTLSEGRAHEAIGFDSGAWVGRSIFDLGSEAPGVTELFNRALAGEELTAILNGRDLTFEARFSPMRGSDRAIEGVIIVATDITERRAQAEALAESEESARAAAEENAVMAEIGRVIGSSLDISLVYNRFAEQTRRLIDFDAIAVMSVLPNRQTFRVAYMSGISIPQRQPGVEYPLAGTATEEAFRSGKPVRFQPDSKDQVISAFPGLLPGWEQGIRSFIAVPLLSHNEEIGVLWICSRATGAYLERDVEVAERVASQIAGAVANSQLYEEIQHFYSQEQRHAEQFRTIGELGRQFTSILDVDELLSNIGAHGATSLGYERTAIGLVEGEELVFSCGANPHLETPVRRSLAESDQNQGITGLVASTGRPIIVPDVDSEPRYRPVEDVRSSVTVPISAGGHTLGVLHSESRRVNAFDEADQVVLQALAQEIGIAIQNARLFQEQQERAEFFRVVGELSSRMSSNLDLEALLQQTVSMIQETFDHYHVGIGLLDGDDVVYKSGAGAQSDNPQFEFDPARLKVGSQGLTGWVAESGEPLLVRDVSQEPRYVALRHLNTRSELTIPIRAKGEVIGVLDLQSDRLNDFDEADLVTLQSLASEAGIAIENARMYEAERRRNEQMAAIHAVALNVSSVLTLGELLPHVVQLVRETFGYHTVGVFLIDAASQEAVLEAVDSSDDNLPVRGTRMRVGSEGIVGHVAGTGLPWITGDVGDDPFYTALSIDQPETKSELAMPIKQGDVVVGVLDVHSAEPSAFGDSDMLTAHMLANQLAVAIENARIFDETRDLAVLEERNRMAREIHDTLAQGFTGIVIQLEAGEQAMEGDSQGLRDHISVAKSLARECLAQARRSVWNLLPESLEHDPLDVILATEVDRFAVSVDGTARFTLLGSRRQLPAVAQAALLRICQESLTNIRKYADASEVDVTLDYALDFVTLTVKDNGVGFDPERVRIEEGRGGFGLTGMRQRARLLRGDVEIASAPGQGAKVIARIPIG